MESQLFLNKLALLWPEIALFITTCVVMVLGVSRHRDTRVLCPPLAIVGLLVSGYLAYTTTPATTAPLPYLAMYGKLLVVLVGIVLMLLLSGTVDRELEAQALKTGTFDTARGTRGEFYAFILFSLTGLMLCAGADDLIFLFLALELTSLPTYVMVSISTAKNRSMEAGVKYFFLGALGAAIFLYGFALIYGATGHTNFGEIARVLHQQAQASGEINALAIAGIVVTLLGLCFKIAAVPMHFYTPDVYQGASAGVSGFLAFVPKAAGFFGIMLIASLVGWHYGPGNTPGHQLPEAIRVMLWVIAAMTMTVGNVLALLQTSVKRLLAYSSIAHSGYMLVGVVAGPGQTDAGFARNGLSAVIFYLAAYGITTAGAFAVVACIERRAKDGSLDEVDRLDDYRGLVRSQPLLGWTLVLSSMGLLGLPPLLGFMGKLPLFTSAIGAGEVVLVVILGLNSAIAAYYYLRLAYTAFIAEPETPTSLAQLRVVPFPARLLACSLSIAGVVGLSFVADPLGRMAVIGGTYQLPERDAQHRAGKPLLEESAAPHSIAGVSADRLTSPTGR